MSSDTLYIPRTFISITDYGAIGDDSTDNADAIAECFAVAVAQQKAVFVPSGVYRTSGKIVLDGVLNASTGHYGNITVFGEGTGSVLKYTGSGTFFQIGAGGAIQSIGTGNPATVTFTQPHGATTGDSFIFAQTAATPDIDGTQTVTVTSETEVTIPINVTGGAGAAGGAKTNKNIQHVTFRHLSLKGNGGNTVGIDWIGIGAHNDLFCVHFDGWGAAMQTDDVSQIHCYSCYFEDNVYGPRLGMAANAWCFVGCQFSRNSEVGLEIGWMDSRFQVNSPPGSKGIEILGCNFSNNKIGCVVGGNITDGINIIGGYAEDNTRSVIEIGHDTTLFTAPGAGEAAALGTVSIRNWGLMAHNPSGTTDDAPIKAFYTVTLLEVFSPAIQNTPAGVATVKSRAAIADGSGLRLDDLRSPCWETSAGTQTSLTAFQQGIGIWQNLIAAGFKSNTNGSAGIGAFTWFADQDTGMYRVAENEIGFSAGSTGMKLHITSAGAHVVAGTSAVDARVGGTLSTNTTPVGNVGAGEDDLMTYSVTGNTLNTNGQAIQLFAAGTIANNANAKRIRVKFGATTIFDTGALPTSAAIDWFIQGQIIRTGAATQKCIVSISTNNATIPSSSDYTTAAETLSGAITLKLTGEAVSDNDIVEELLRVGWV